MKTIILTGPLMMAAVGLAVAQQPPARPPASKDDAAALEAAIRAVDRATDKNQTEKKTDGPGKAVPAVPAQPVPGPARPGATKPESSPAKPVKPKTPPVTQTLITGLEDAELDNARNIIVFRKNVVVDRPDLKIWCDQLEIALNQKSDNPGAAAPPAAPQAAGEPDVFGAESIKSATATSSNGGLVVIWRKTETGDVVAVGRKAVYTSADGAFTITGLPEVLRDMSFHFHSPGESDRLVLFKNGSARGSKKQDLNLSQVRAREIRQRMFSHVPGRRPPEASAPKDSSAPEDTAGGSPPAATLPPAPTRSAAGN
jgi:lipopolysaccharide export system protein LptA